MSPAPRQSCPRGTHVRRQPRPRRAATTQVRSMVHGRGGRLLEEGAGPSLLPAHRPSLARVRDPHHPYHYITQWAREASSTSHRLHCGLAVCFVDNCRRVVAVVGIRRNQAQMYKKLAFDPRLLVSPWTQTQARHLNTVKDACEDCGYSIVNGGCALGGTVHLETDRRPCSRSLLSSVTNCE